ncbi:MAG: cupin domain-containing protein, partial [Promethearchaeota archaeon]
MSEHIKEDPEILDLESLLDYQEGSVVSRMLLNKKIGTVTLFSFDKGEGLSEHTAPFDALAYIIDGKAEII